MKLIEEITELLSREEPAVEAALVKTKVLLYKLGESQLASWVNAEINGYKDAADIPDYRVISTRVLATVTNGYTARWNNTPIPIGHLPADFQEDLRRTKIGQGVAALEALVKTSESALSKPLSPELYGLLAKGLERGIVVESAHVEIGRTQLVGILAQIRSRLLDFILELSSRLPSDLPDAETVAKSKAIDAAGLFQSAIFGDNATIIVGSHNQQTASNTSIRVGDFESLATFLRGKNVADSEISELKAAIHEDGDTPHDRKQLGPKVKEWMKGMFQKAVDASWQIELGVASSVLATALSRYYGWP